jgi:F-type H+-transporting ATPase subunit b
MLHFAESPEFWVAVAFVIFVAGLWKKVAPLIASALDARAARIEKDLEEAAKLREEAHALLAQYQRKQHDALKEAADIVAQAKVEAERYAARAAVELDGALKRREQLAMQRIAQAEQQALQEVRAAAVDIAIAATSKLLVDKLDAGRQDALIDAAIKELPRNLNA